MNINLIIKARLCKCNNCEQVFIDQNPQIGQPVFEVEECKYPDLSHLTDAEGCYWGCPVCETDGYLTDVTGLTDLGVSTL